MECCECAHECALCRGLWSDRIVLLYGTVTPFPSCIKILLWLFVIRKFVKLVIELKLQGERSGAELPHANRDVRQEVRGSVCAEYRDFNCASPASRPQHINMFGPFRLTNPLSGGLLWCVSPRSIYPRNRSPPPPSIISALTIAISHRLCPVTRH